MEEKEIWKPLFEENIKKDLGRLDGVFLVSNLGRIKDGLNDKILNPSIWEDYQVVTLYHNFIYYLLVIPITVFKLLSVISLALV